MSWSSTRLTIRLRLPAALSAAVGLVAVMAAVGALFPAVGHTIGKLNVPASVANLLGGADYGTLTGWFRSEIAVIYGLAPGLLQQWTLLRRVLWIAATSGMAAQAGDLAVQSLGGGLVGRLSANTADALYTALRTARLGLYAMETCRPVAFLPAERRGLSTLLRKAAVSVLALLERGDRASPLPPELGGGQG